MRRVSRSIVLLTALIANVAALTARAEPVRSGNVAAELASDVRTIRPGGMFTLGVSLRPDEGWHTYWRNSGDSGLPTTVEWKLPEGFHAGELMWPHPVRLGKPPYVTYGYERDALLLTNLDAPSSLRPGSDVEIVAAVRWLACREDACVPGKADLSIRLRVDAAAPQSDSRWQPLFARARSELPRPAMDWSATAREDGDRIRLDITAPANVRPGSGSIRLFPLEPGVLDASSDAKIEQTETGFAVEIPRDEKKVALPDLLGLVLVTDAARTGGPGGDAATRALRLSAHKENLAAKGAAKPADQVAAAKQSASAARPRVAGGAIRLWLAVVLALAGGLILNLMPCVFPVLTLKILGFVHVAHHDAKSVRWHGYAFAAGVITSFWVLAGVLIVLRAAGGSFGWGFQLQQPLFVAFLAALLLGMSLNLFGVFEMGSAMAGKAGRFDSASGYHGSFLSGALATVLATPCSAPFMGTAIGYALVQPAAKTLIVFTALGAGMALPYLVLACVPMLMRRLPRPGPWMERFREAMAFPLLATVAWLIWIFGQQTGNDGVLALLIALLVATAGIWIAARFSAGRYRSVAAGLAGACMLAAIAMIVSVVSPRSTASVAPRGVTSNGVAGVNPAGASATPASATPAANPSAAPGGASAVQKSAASAPDAVVEWHPWDPDAILQHRTEGRVVFVDFTADWCLSCKVNERVALSGGDFSKRMSDANAVAMKADWTSSDPRITKALADFGRSGVPLYVVYPRNPESAPIVLPQILTPAIVIEAIEKAVA